QDAFSRSGWLWPVDAKGEPLKATSYMAVGFYVAKYVNKKSDMDLAAKGLGAKEWNNSLKTKLSRSEERFSRNAETDLVCRLLLEKKKKLSNIAAHEEERNEDGNERDHKRQDGEAE